MAGAKESPRQKMINLMYLVFIAMLALNMSKEVLTAFGLISEQVENNNNDISVRIGEFNKIINTGFSTQDSIIKSQGLEIQNVWAKKKKAADSVNLITSEFLKIIDGFRNKETDTLIVRVKGKDDIIRTDYETMDKPDYWNRTLFDQDKGLNEDGNKFLKGIKDYVLSFKSITDSQRDKKTGLNTTYDEISESVVKAFATDSVYDGDAIKQSWMRYHMFGYPEVATNTKLTIMKANALNYQASLLSALIGGQYKMESKLTNFDAYVISDKSSYYRGSQYEGRIVLGKKSNSLTPSKITINGNDVPLTSVVNGEILLNFPAGGSAKYHQITGEIVFDDSGEQIKIPVNQEYEVIEKPTSASIQIKNRNTLFYGTDNFINVSVPGLASNKVRVSGSGVSSSGGKGSYKIRPTSTKDLIVKVSGKLPNGSNFSDSQKFKIIKLPAPLIKFNGKEGGSLSKGSIGNGRLSGFYDPALGIESKVKIRGFDVKIGRKTFKCSGARLSSSARNFLKNSPKGIDVIFKNVGYSASTSQGTIATGVSITIK